MRSARLGCGGVHRVDDFGVLRRDQAALELHGGRDLVAAGFPEGRQDGEALDLLHPRQLAVAGVDRGVDGGVDGRVGGQGGGGGVAGAVVGGEGGGRVGVEHDQRDHVGPPVADGHYLGDQRAGGQHGVFDVGRGHVLARRVDDQLFLAVDDPHVSVVIDGGDVAGVQPPVRIDGFGGLGGVVVVALHHR